MAARAALMQVLVKAGAGPAEPEPAIRAVPAAGPGHDTARHNLGVLRRMTGRWDTANQYPPRSVPQLAPDCPTD